MKSVILLLLLFSIRTSILANESIEEICSKTTCRPQTKLTLKKKDKSTWSGTIDKAPYVFNDMVNIISGEEFWVTYKVSGDKLTELKYSKNKVENALHFSLQQDQYEMTLTVNAKFESDLKFHAAGIRAGRKYLRRVETCPIIVGRPLIQKIKKPLSQLVLMEFKLLKEGEERKCE